MRNFIALAFCFLVVSQQTYACRDPLSGETLFFETIPKPEPDADVIATVSLSDVNVGTATAIIKQVLKTSDARIHKGARIPLEYRQTSCGPEPIDGAEGIVIAKTGTDSNGHFVMYPYVRKYDGRISPPSMSK